jgi:hypothetical protein
MNVGPDLALDAQRDRFRVRPLKGVVARKRMAKAPAVVDPLASRSPKASSSARQKLPATVAGSFQGTAQAFQDSMRGL